MKAISILYLGAFILLGLNFPFARLLALACFGYLACQVLKDVPIRKNDEDKKIIETLSGLENLP